MVKQIPVIYIRHNLNISHLPFHGVACGVCVAQSLIICVVFCRLLFGFLSFSDMAFIFIAEEEMKMYPEI
jgi:hypothetical protein